MLAHRYYWHCFAHNLPLHSEWTFWHFLDFIAATFTLDSVCSNRQPRAPNFDSSWFAPKTVTPPNLADITWLSWRSRLLILANRPPFAFEIYLRYVFFASKPAHLLWYSHPLAHSYSTDDASERYLSGPHCFSLSGISNLFGFIGLQIKSFMGIHFVENRLKSFWFRFSKPDLDTDPTSLDFW